MNKHEQIKTHLRMIHKASTPGKGWSIYAIEATVEKELDAIKALLQPEPETLASAVLGLTAECNDLSRERNRLRNELTEMTLNYNAAEKQVERLKADLDAVTGSNAYLRGCNNRLEQNLRVLEEEVVKQTRYTGARKEHIKILNQDLDRVTQTNVELMEEIVKQNKYVKIIERETRNYTRRLTWWSKLQVKK